MVAIALGFKGSLFLGAFLGWTSEFQTKPQKVGAIRALLLLSQHLKGKNRTKLAGLPHMTCALSVGSRGQGEVFG